ncbi:TIGR04283 family arsenosugar biosynthesis glycosyltransferase [Leptolyngbya ohadii]|uniref:TIGR04283 family arsenosugar biosynthesis glycosyltransferase n=1 Tax=Leptolyngbya ohadii TaxID=1962290 RepID=UPI000B598786|nr:TIGR04283 family arsenosugar biosynthesis glycosyltransferase [Leptolyngbya ohadii]
MISPNRLLIFTRYPVPGQAKTRLIPALGAEGSALLQRQMTEHTLRQIEPLIQTDRCSAEIWYAAGADAENELQQMRDWLGAERQYLSQVEGDLGVKLTAAFQNAFKRGAEKVLAIGTDCPGLGSDRLKEAYQQLESHDLVLGKATDGGYYLIGMKRLIPELFRDITWGTSEVLRQTVAIAQSLNLSIAYLDELSDIDYPEDLPIWHRAKEYKTPLSVIIPTVNEGRSIQATLQNIQEACGEEAIEVLVIDGKSEDDTIAQVQAAGIPVISAPRNRAEQMNLGAQLASGENFLFLHADTRLPAGFPALVRQTLVQPGTIAGAFQLQIAGDLPGLRLVEWGVNRRSHLLQMPYGDQAIFLSAAAFYELGGFPELPIMEDFEMILRLRQRGGIRIVPAAVKTSGRRWQRLGVLKTTLVNQAMITGYFLGVPPDRLARWYRGLDSASRDRPIP